MNTSEKRGEKRGVLICGAYGMGNAGDEAILEAIVRQMRSLDESLPLCVVTRQVKETEQRLKVRAVYTFDIPAVWREMRRAKLFLNGGGTLIQNVTSRRSLWYYLFTLAAAKRRGCRVLMYGCGIGPVRYAGDIRLTKQVLNRFVDKITLREPSSLEELKNFGVTKPEILLASDPALTLPAASEAEIDAAMQRFSLTPGARYLCFCLRNWPGYEAKVPVFAAGVRYALEKYGLKPVFLSINHQSDGDAAEKVTEYLKSQNGFSDADFRILREPMPTALTIGLLSRMTAAVSMRLHGLIFAAGCGVPLVGIAYDPKVTAFLDYSGCTLSAQFESLTETELLSLIDRAVELTGHGEEQAQRVASLRAREQVNLETAKRMLEE